MILNNDINTKKIIGYLILFIILILIICYIIKKIIKNKNIVIIGENQIVDQIEDETGSYIISKYNFLEPVDYYDKDFWYLMSIAIKNVEEDRIIERGFLQPSTHLIYNSTYKWIGYFNDDMELTLKEDMNPTEIEIITNWFILCHQLTNLKTITIQQNVE